MELNPGDKIRVIKDVRDKCFILRPGIVLEVTCRKGKSLDHIRRCRDQKGRTRIVHMQDVMDGCFEKIFSVPVVEPVVINRRRKLSEVERKLAKQVEELKLLQNILLKEKNREISMILEAKGVAAQHDDTLNDLKSRLRASMRDWVLAIQFSPPHSAMRKEIQSYLKEL